MHYENIMHYENFMHCEKRVSLSIANLSHERLDIYS